MLKAITGMYYNFHAFHPYGLLRNNPKLYDETKLSDRLLDMSRITEEIYFGVLTTLKYLQANFVSDWLDFFSYFIVYLVLYCVAGIAFNK